MNPSFRRYSTASSSVSKCCMPKFGGILIIESPLPESQCQRLLRFHSFPKLPAQDEAYSFSGISAILSQRWAVRVLMPEFNFSRHKAQLSANYSG